MITSYTLNDWDGGASNAQSNQQVSNDMAGNGTNSNWNVRGSLAGGLDALDAQNVDDMDLGRKDAYAIFGSPNQADPKIDPQIKESTTTSPPVPNFGDAPVSLPVNTNSSSGTSPNDVNDASNVDMDVVQQSDTRTFIPIPTSALHSPTARKNASERAASPLMARLLGAIGAVPNSPTPSSRVTLGQHGRQEKEKDPDAMSLYTADALGEDEDTDAIVVESLLNNFSPSKTEPHSDIHPADFQSPSHSSHNAYSHSHATASYHQQPLHQHTSLFTPPPSDECPPSSVGTSRSSCPPADRLFTPEPEPEPSPLSSSYICTTTAATRTPQAVTTPLPQPRPFPIAVPDKTANTKGKGKEREEAEEKSKKSKKRRQIMDFVQVPPLKRPRSDYVAFGISGSTAAGVVKKRKAILGPPPSAAGPSSSSRPSYSSAGPTSALKTAKPRPLGAKVKKPTLSVSSPIRNTSNPNYVAHKSSHNRNASFSLEDALQASFSHNERVGTLDSGRISGSVSGNKDKGKGKERAWDEFGQKIAIVGPARIRAGGGFGPGVRPPVSVASTSTSISTTSGSVAVVASKNLKKRPLKAVDADADSDADADDYSYTGTSSKGVLAKAKKRPRVDIDLTMSASDEEREREREREKARKRRAATQRRREEEEEDEEDDDDDDDEVEIVKVVKTKPRPGPKLSSSSTLRRITAPSISKSGRPPPSFASMRPPLPLSSILSRPAPSSSYPSSYAKGKPKAVDSTPISTSPPKSKPRPAYAAMTPSNSQFNPKAKAQFKEKDRPSSTPSSLSSQPAQSHSQSGEKENVHQKFSGSIPNSKPKSMAKRKSGAIYDARNDLVRLVLGDLEPVGQDVMGVNLRGLKAEIEPGQGAAGLFLAGPNEEDLEGPLEEKKLKDKRKVQAPWVCRPPRHSKLPSGLPEGGEEDISVGGPVLVATDVLSGSASTVAKAGKGESKEDDVQPSKKEKRKMRTTESLFSEEEDEDEDEEDGRLDVELELEHETDSDDISLLQTTSRAVRGGLVASSSSTSTLSAPAGPASRHHQQQQTRHELQGQGQAPLKKIDLAARFRKNKSAGTSASASAGKVERSGSTSSVQKSAARLTARHASQSQQPPQSSQPHQQPHLSTPLAATSSSISMSMTTSSGPTLTHHNQLVQHEDVNVDEHIASAPSVPSAKALGKRRAAGPGLFPSQTALSTTMSPPPPPYTPVLQHAFSALSNASAALGGGGAAGTNISMNVNATINYHHHHHSPLHDHSQQHLLRGPNADLDIFLVSPIRSAVSVGGGVGVSSPTGAMDLGAGGSGSGGLYSTAYPQNLHLRDEAIMLGATQSDLAHLYSPPGVPRFGPRSQAVEGERGSLFPLTVLDSLDLGAVQPEDPWATLTDENGRYTYSTVNPAFIGGDDDVDVLSGNPLFSDEEVVVPRTEVTEMDADVSVRDGSPAFPPSASLSSRASRSLSASATRPRPPSEIEVQKSPSPSIPSPSVAASNDSEADENLPSDVEVKKTIPKKRKRTRDPSTDALLSATASAAAEEEIAITKSNTTRRSTTTPGSEFSNVPLVVHERSRRKHVPRRMDDDMIPTSGFSLERKGRKSDSEYTPTTASIGSGGEEEDATKSDSEGFESDSADRVVVVKRKKLKSVSSLSSGPIELSKALVRAGPWPTTTSALYCHQCRNKSNILKMPCTCGKLFCMRCLANRYPHKEFHATLKDLGCPACLNYCNCTACCKRRGETYVSTAKRPPGKRAALGGETNLLSVPTPTPTPTPVPVLNGPIPETARYWGSIYSLTTGEKLTSTFVTTEMGVDKASGAPTVVYAPASAAVAAPLRPKKSQALAKGRVFVGAVQRRWGLGRHPKIGVIDPFKSTSSVRGKKSSGREVEQRFYVGNPAFLKYRRPEQEDPYSYLLEGLSPLTSLDDSSDEEPDGAGQEAEFFDPGSLEDSDISRAIALALNACGLSFAHLMITEGQESENAP